MHTKHQYEERLNIIEIASKKKEEKWVWQNVHRSVVEFSHLKNYLKKMV